MTNPNKHSETNNISTSRRTILRAGSAAVAITGLAGCSALPGGGLGGFNYTQYLYDPDEVDTNSYQFNYFKPSTIVENEDEFDDDVYDGTEDSLNISNLTDIDYDEIQHVVQAGQTTVIAANFTKEDVVDELEDNDFDDDDEISGYETFYNEQETQGVAIQDNRVIHTGNLRYNSNFDPEDLLELVIESESGDADRYADAYDSFGPLTDNLGSGTVVTGTAFDDESDFIGLENVVAYGGSLSVNGESSNVKFVFVHDDEGDPDRDDAEDFTDEIDDIDDTSISTSGRVTEITGSTDTDDLTSISPF